MKSKRIQSFDETARGTDAVQLSGVAEIAGLPFDSFDELQAAVKARSFNLGVDPLAAAEWTDRFGNRWSRTVASALSLLLFVVGAASVIAALVTNDYWLFAALPIQALTFYISQPSSPIRAWVTVGGALSIAFFVNLLLNGWVTGATLVAYAGLTFASVRAAGFVSSQAFRKALLADEAAFMAAYQRGECSLRNNNTKREHKGSRRPA
jgi:hypothetical protein